MVTPSDQVCLIHGMSAVAMEERNNGKAMAQAGLMASAKQPPKIDPNT